jgi:hypothetical protein
MKRKEVMRKINKRNVFKRGPRDLGTHKAVDAVGRIML